ncbi:MAG TPA: hypothetical protein VLG44_02320, partial [Chlamydiales bacterium]|nr:hypothetical protein [Chlamydiales bacterium]
PASLTKIVTGMYVIEEQKLALDTMITPSLDCFLLNDPKLGEVGLRHPKHRLDHDATIMGLKKGETLSVEALLYGLILLSGSEAANALAEASSASIATFIEGMNCYVKNLGCASTQFTNPSGMHDPEQVACAHDFALIMRRALQLPLFMKIMGTKTYKCPSTNKQPERTLYHTNRLLRKGAYSYPLVIGGKTGYTSKALSNLAVAAKNEDRTLIAVVLGCSTKTSRYDDVIRMFNTAFEESKVDRLLVGAKRFTHKMKGASSEIHGQLREDISISYYPSEEPKASAFVFWDAHLPVKKGDKVGEVRILDENKEILVSAPLYATKEVDRTFSKWVSDLFSQKAK